jgi:hypothetical protein
MNFWPDTVPLLGRPLLPLTPVLAGWDKGFLLLQDLGYAFEPDPLPILAVYLVELQPAGPGHALLEHLPPARGLAELLALASTPFHLLGPAGRLQEFDGLGQLVERIAIGKVRAGRGAAGVDALCRAIEDDVARLLAG